MLTLLPLLLAAPPNVLFIAVDDLRPEIASFGVEMMHTPNIDRLAARGVRFENAYCNVPVCGASRASLMTGVRPSQQRFRAFDCYAEKQAPGAIPLHAHFKANGYTVRGGGKIFHNTGDSRDGWSQPVWVPKNAPRYARQENIDAAKSNPSAKKRGAVTEAAEVPDNFYKDGKLADWAVEQVDELATTDKPFFLAVGFWKPHLPFIAPQRDWDRYGPESPQQYFVPPDIPRQAIHSSGEIRAYAGVPKKGILPLPLAEHLIHGYRACITYTDRQIGRVLDALDASGEADNTIIVLWGDHGWNLGEHSMWCKHCCFETSMRTPLIVAAPFRSDISGGEAPQALVEFTDIYPTLCDLASLQRPDGKHPENKPKQLDGESLVPLMTGEVDSLRPWAIGRYGLGDTIIDGRYRYTEYRTAGGKLTGTMLFDHETDPEEINNIVQDESVADVVEKLKKQLNGNKGRDGKSAGPDRKPRAKSKQAA